MDSSLEDLTTFWTCYSMFKYRVMPFGLTNGPSTFQQFVNNMFMDYLDVFLTAYMDDLLIYSTNTLEHEVQVKKVLERLHKASLQASLEKCEFGVEWMKYLGFIVSTEGIVVDPEKTSVICDWNWPTMVKGVQSFLGFCNFYQHFIKGYSHITKLLNGLTCKDRPFKWDLTCKLAFEELKD